MKNWRVSRWKLSVNSIGLHSWDCVRSVSRIWHFSVVRCTLKVRARISTAVKSRSTVDKLCCRYCILTSRSPLNETPRRLVQRVCRTVLIHTASRRRSSPGSSPFALSVVSSFPSTSLSPNIDRSPRRSVTPAPITARSVSGAPGSRPARRRDPCFPFNRDRAWRSGAEWRLRAAATDTMALALEQVLLRLCLTARSHTPLYLFGFARWNW